MVYCSGGSRPSEEGGGRGGVGGQSLKKIFSALRASFWSKNKRGVLGRPPVPWIHH